MKGAITPVNPAQYIELDKRDYDTWRNRLLDLEERMLKVENQALSNEITIKNLVGEARDLRKLVLDLQRQFSLFMVGTKERLDVISLLLPQSETPLVRKDLE